MGLVLLVRRQRHLPEVRGAARGGARGARRAAAGRDRRPVPVAAAGAREAERARERGRDRRGAGRGARRLLRRARGDGRGERGPRSSAGERPVVRLGQNFLADTNLLAAIVREAGLGPGDVVLEVGGGEGALTARAGAAGRRRCTWSSSTSGCARRSRRSPPSTATSSCTSATRCGSTSAALDPAPNRMVANLPYSIATPLILRTIAELPGARVVDADGPARDRRPAARGAGLAHLRRRRACSSSSPARCGCCARVDRAVFTPRPRVDSALIGLRRIGPGGLAAEVAALVRDAFAHRRKSLARSLEHARPGSREPARAALERARAAGRRARRAAGAGSSSSRSRRRWR